MSGWWETAYKGGPMVKVKGFPRPLYPPDANQHGKKPSSDGPDVLAYKRTVCRAGRWGEWAPSSWDDSYSNAFAHGRGGNVKDSGIAGVQRQQQIDATGWLGERTFNTLRSILVPEGPNKGQPAMDAYAASLIDQAFGMFAGGQAGSAAARLAKATSYLGYSEQPAGSNKTTFGAWYGLDGQPWCAMFVTYCDQLGGKPSSAFKRGSRYAYVPYLLADARSGLYGLSVTGSPQPGDIVVYDWELDGLADHVGIYEAPSGGGFSAIEGNTSTSSNSNGGQVMRRSRSKGAGVTFIRVRE